MDKRRTGSSRPGGRGTPAKRGQDGLTPSQNRAPADAPPAAQSGRQSGFSGARAGAAFGGSDAQGHSHHDDQRKGSGRPFQGGHWHTPGAAPRLPVPWAVWLRSPLAHLQMLLGLALVLGGGGVASGLNNAVIQLAALAIMVWHRPLVFRFLRAGPRALVALVLASMALPLAQILPLPPFVWHELPGREPVLEAHRLLGLAPDAWIPLSLDRARTLVAFLGTLAPAALIIVGTSLRREDKAQLAWMLAGAALVALLLGAFQLTTANTSGLLHAISPKPDVLYATFANRNSTAMLFVLAILLLAAVPMYRGRAGVLLGSAGIGLLFLGAVLTQSRSGMALAGVALSFVVLRLVLGFRQARRGGAVIGSRPLAAAGLFAMALVAMAGASAISGGRAADSIARLTSNETDRPEIWDDAVHAARAYWPVGSGMGTFDEVFQLHESLEHLSPRRAGRAHNDWIELAIESGIAGLALAGAWLVWCLGAVIGGRPETLWLRIGAGVAVMCIAAQSLLDYPLRNQTILCVAALLVVLLHDGQTWRQQAGGRADRAPA